MKSKYTWDQHLLYHNDFKKDCLFCVFESDVTTDIVDT